MANICQCVCKGDLLGIKKLLKDSDQRNYLDVVIVLAHQQNKRDIFDYLLKEVNLSDQEVSNLLRMSLKSGIYEAIDYLESNYDPRISRIDEIMAVLKRRNDFEMMKCLYRISGFDDEVLDNAGTYKEELINFKMQLICRPKSARK